MASNTSLEYMHLTLDQVSPANQPDSIDLTTPGAVKLWDGSFAGVGEVFAFRDFVVITEESDTATTHPVISIGTNNPNYDNIVEAYAVSLVEGRADVVPVRDPRVVAAPDTDIYVNVKQEATAVTLTAYVAFGAHRYFG